MKFPLGLTTSEASNERGQKLLALDLAALRSPMIKSLHRVEVFIGYAHHTTRGEPLSSVRLEAPMALSVGVPSSIPEAQRKPYQDDYRGWIVGQALIEIDQSYQRFAACCLEILRYVDAAIKTGRHYRGKQPSENTWNLHKAVYDHLKDRSERHIQESSFLRTLGNARNCLVHDSGIVTERRTNDGDRLRIRWRGYDCTAADDAGEVITLPRDKRISIAEAGVGRMINLNVVTRELLHRVGDRVSLTHYDLSEILFFYSDLFNVLCQDLQKIIETKAAEARRAGRFTTKGRRRQGR